MAKTLGRIVVHPDIADGKPCLRMPFTGSATGPADDPPDYVPIEQLLSVLEQGGASSQGLTNRDINLCNAFAATRIPGTPQYERNNRYRTVKILFDENMPYGLIPPLTQQLSNLSHVYLEGLGGNTDEFIYNRHWHRIEDDDPHDRRQDRKTKRIIISRDMDMTDLARAQWMNRIACSAMPEHINFSDVNVVFRIRDEALTDTENAEYYNLYAREIMKAAFSCEAASYIISRSGVRAEPGSRLQDLVEKLEEDEKVRRAKSGLLSEVELASAREMRRERRMNYHRHPSREVAIA